VKARDALEELDVPCEVFAMSAHRTPERVVEYVKGAADRGLLVIIACAGMAAHLAGVVAAHTTLPVIGVPLASGKLQGLDALLSTVQMPPGIPVATVGVDATRNAGYLAARIVAIRHPEVAARIEKGLEAERKKYDAVDVPSAARPAKS
jgi:5-(carboxyamino)imidazole ribonucleotide mutase